MRLSGNYDGQDRAVSALDTDMARAFLPSGCSGVTDGSVSAAAPATERTAPASRRSILLVPITLVLLAAASGTRAWADHPPTGVVEALQRKYLVTQTTPDSAQITKDGTTMSMKCAGIYSLPSSSMMEPDNKVVDGKVQQPSMFTRLTLTKMGTHVLQSGDKVYITKIESKGDGGDQLRFTVLTVDSLDVGGQDQQARYKAVISFKFKKGYLDDAPPDEVAQAVEAILAPDTGGDDSQGGDNAASQNQGPPQSAPAAAPAPQRAVAPPPPPPPPAAPAGPPPTISIGESSTQVLEAMGMPLQMIDLGKKKTYIYKHMKVVFIDDKVSDVE